MTPKHYDRRGFERPETAAETKAEAEVAAAVMRSIAAEENALSALVRAPYVGAIVHYMGPGPTPSPLAAIITQCDDDGCYLAVFSTTALVFLKAPFSEVAAPGHWSWPLESMDYVRVLPSDVTPAQAAMAGPAFGAVKS